MDGMNEVINVDLASDVSGATKAKTEIEQLAAAAHRLQNEFDAGQVSEARYNAGMNQIQASILKANDAFDEAMTGARNFGAAAKSGFNPRSLLEFSRAAEDAQYGVAGIVNNIPGLVQSLGGGAGITGVASLAAIGIAQLVKHWDEFSGLIGYAGTFKPPIDGLERMNEELKKAQDEVEKLGKQSGLTWIELAKFKEAQVKVKVLTEYVKDQRAVDASLEGQSEAERKRGAGFKSAIDESGEASFKDYKAALEGQKDAKGQVYNFKRETVSSVEDALRENWAAALEGNQRAIRGIAESLPQDDLFRANIAKFDPKQVEADKAAEKRRDELAKELQGRYNVARAGGEDVNADQIRAELERGGVKPEDARKLAAGVLGQLSEGFAAELRERSGKKGLDAAGVAADILADDAKRVEREAAPAKRAADKRETEDDRRAAALAKPLQDRFNLESARAGRDDAITLDMTKAELRQGGATEGEVEKYAAGVLDKLRDAFNEELRKRAGKEGTDVAGANDSIVADDQRRRDKARDDLLTAARQSGEKAEAARKEKPAEQYSQVITGAAALRDAIQQSVKAPARDPVAEESLATQRKMETYLRTISEKKFGGGPARLG